MLLRLNLPALETVPAFAGVAVCCLAGVLACGGSKPEPKKAEPGQSFAAAMQLVCFVDDHVKPENPDDPLELDERRNEFLEDQVKNPDVIYHRTLWRVQSNHERAKTIRDLSCQADLERCPYADALASGDY